MVREKQLGKREHARFQVPLCLALKSVKKEEELEIFVLILQREYWFMPSFSQDPDWRQSGGQ